MTPILPLVLGLGLACGSSRANRGPVSEPAAWKSDEGKLQARLDMATTLIDTGSPDGAIAVVTQLRSEGHKGTQIDLVQARAMREAGLVDDAEVMLSQLVRKHPRSAEGHDQLGVLYLDQQRLDEALTHLRRAADLAGDDSMVLNNLGFALMTAQQHAEAVDVLRTALQIDPASHLIRNNLGFALVAEGREDEAYRVFRAGQPEADARYNLGLGLEMRGDDAAAVDQYAAVVQSWPTHEPSLEGLQRLRPADLHLISSPRSDSPEDP